MIQLNGYIKFMPSEALEKRDGVKEEFTELDLRKILDMAMPHSYRKKLTGNDWNIYKQPFMKTIDKLVTYEPDIKAEVAKAKSNKELADKVYGIKGTKRNNNGTPKVAEADKTTCKTCGKKHKGKCWKLESGGDAPLTWKNGGKPFDKKQMKYINKMFHSHSATKADSDSDSEKGSLG